MRYIHSYYTDIGVKRKTNQDSLALIKANTDFGEVVLAVICDGMGGHQAGELASKTVIKRFERWFKVVFPTILYDNLTYEVIRDNWASMICECNDRLVSYGVKHDIELGSTVTAFLFVGDYYYVVHVGDSRGYVIGDYNFVQITKDHSLIAEELRKGTISAEEAQSDKRKNILLECVGITKSINMDFYAGTIIPNVCYMICTDGFWHKLTDNDLTHYLAGTQFKDNKMMRMHLNYLVELVKERGEKDNISVIGIVPEMG